MKIITRNVKRANEKSPLRDYLFSLNADVLFLQEVTNFPKEVDMMYHKTFKYARSKTWWIQKFWTAVLSRIGSIQEKKLVSQYDWVNDQLKYFQGNYIACTIQVDNDRSLNLVSVYSPARSINEQPLENNTSIQLQGQKKLRLTEILWSAIKDTKRDNESWIVWWDYNASITFDKDWQDLHGVKYWIRSSWNAEILERMNQIWFTESLQAYNNAIIPTFKHSREKLDHQIDHLFVTNDVYSTTVWCCVWDQSVVIWKWLSDHLPIIAEFAIE